jgi:uncharacterized protein YjbI with pentapeptide repeats
MSMLWWVVIGTLVVILSGALWWWMPRWQMQSITVEDQKARADIEDNFRKTVGQALGGIAVLIGASLAFYGTQQTLLSSDAQSRRSIEASEKQGQQNLEASRALLISQQVAKGFEQLGSDKVVMRLGGIYALEGVMNGSELYSRPVLDALCAFVRDGTKGHDDKDDQPATDIQAALTVIARREGDVGGINLSSARIPKARLPRAHLIGANLIGVNLGGAWLEGASLGSAFLNGAVLVGADLNRANLDHANLFNSKLTGAKLQGARLDGALLRNVTLTDADLEGADLTNAILVEANLTGANLKGANLTDATLTRATLIRADLTDANLNGANLSSADLSGTKIYQAQLDNACGADVKLQANLTLKPCAEMRKL